MTRDVQSKQRDVAQEGTADTARCRLYWVATPGGEGHKGAGELPELLGPMAPGQGGWRSRTGPRTAEQDETRDLTTAVLLVVTFWSINREGWLGLK